MKGHLLHHGNPTVRLTQEESEKETQRWHFSDAVVATDNFCNALIVHAIGSPTTMCSGGNECSNCSFGVLQSHCWSCYIGCSVLGALLLNVMLLLRSGDGECHPAPVEDLSVLGQSRIAL